MSSELRTPRIRLVPQTKSDMLAIIEQMSPADRAQLSPAWLELFERVTEIDPWVLGFCWIEQASGQTIGSGGFKGPPDAEGQVEIAYQVSPEHRGRGFASEGAAALVRFAWQDEAVRRVIAHTLPGPNASTRVLTKIGFRHLGETIDPDDGLVWRWEYSPDD